MKTNNIFYLVLLLFLMSSSGVMSQLEVDNKHNKNSFYLNKIITSKSTRSNLNIIDNYLVNYLKGVMTYWDTKDNYKEKFSIKFGSTDYRKNLSYKIKNSKSSIGVFAPEGSNLKDGFKLYITRIKNKTLQLDSISGKGIVYDFCLSNDGQTVYYLRKSISTSHLGIYAQNIDSKNEKLLLDKLNKIEGRTADFKTKFSYFANNNFKMAINGDDSILSVLGNSILFVSLHNGDIEEVNYKKPGLGEEVSLMKFTANSNKIILSTSAGKDIGAYDLINKKWIEFGAPNFMGGQSYYFDNSHSLIVGEKGYILVQNEQKKVSDTILPRLWDYRMGALINKVNTCIDSNNTMYVFDYQGISKFNLNKLGDLEYEVSSKPIIINNVNQSVISNSLPRQNTISTNDVNPSVISNSLSTQNTIWTNDDTVTLLCNQEALNYEIAKDYIYLNRYDDVDILKKLDNNREIFKSQNQILLNKVDNIDSRKLIQELIITFEKIDNEFYVTKENQGNYAKYIGNLTEIGYRLGRIKNGLLKDEGFNSIYKKNELIHICLQQEYFTQKLAFYKFIYPFIMNKGSFNMASISYSERLFKLRLNSLSSEANLILNEIGNLFKNLKSEDISDVNFYNDINKLSKKHMLLLDLKRVELEKDDLCFAKIKISDIIPSKTRADYFYKAYNDSEVIKQINCLDSETILNDLILNGKKFGYEFRKIKNKLLLEEYYLDTEGRKYAHNSYRYNSYSNKLSHVFYRDVNGLINSVKHNNGFSSTTTNFNKGFKTIEEALKAKESSAPKVKITEMCQACKGTGIGGTDGWTGKKHSCPVCNGSGKNTYSVNRY